MLTSVYAIYDDTAKVFNTPFFMHNDGMAIRAFKGHVNGAVDSALHDFPEQFKLFKLGTFDDSKGEFQTHEPIYIAHGVEVKEEDFRTSKDSQVIYELGDRLRKLEEAVLSSEDFYDDSRLSDREVEYARDNGELKE